MPSCHLVSTFSPSYTWAQIYNPVVQKSQPLSQTASVFVCHFFAVDRKFKPVVPHERKNTVVHPAHCHLKVYFLISLMQMEPSSFQGTCWIPGITIIIRNYGKPWHIGDNRTQKVLTLAVSFRIKSRI